MVVSLQWKHDCNENKDLLLADFNTQTCSMLKEHIFGAAVRVPIPAFTVLLFDLYI